VVSKPQIRFKGKAQADRESAVRHTFWRMSIYRRPAIRHEYWRTIGPQSAAGGLKPLLNSEADIKNLMAGRTDKKPPGDSALLLKHRVKTIFVSTGGADLKLVIHGNILNWVIHAKLPIKI
jgi:hypothetical protein